MTEIEEYVVLSQEHVKRVAELTAHNFSSSGGDPMSASSQLTPEIFLPFSRLHVERSVAQQLTTVCLVDGQVGGVIVSEDLARPLVPKDDPAVKDGTIDMDKFMPILSVHGRMQAEYFATLDKKPSPGEYLHQFLLAVDKRFARRGIATRLIAKNAELGRKRGFRSVITHSTGRFAQGAAKRCGFVTVGSMSYSEATLPNGDLMFPRALEMGHSHAELLVKQLI